MGKNTITIDLTSASEMARFWLSELFRTEISDINGTIDNAKLWALGSDGEDHEMFLMNIQNLEEYKAILNKALDDVEGRD